VSITAPAQLRIFSADPRGYGIVDEVLSSFSGVMRSTRSEL